MAKVYIAYSHEDIEFVDQLANDLRDSGLDLWVDRWELGPGDSLYEKINEGLLTAAYLCPVLSPNSIESEWVTAEIGAAFVMEIEERSITVVPVVYQKCKIPPLLRAKVAARFDKPDYDAELKKLLAKLAPQQDPAEIYGKIQGPEVDNPFRRVRAEFFEDDIGLLANSFSQPEKAKYERIRGARPLLLEGGRGSGKTMILKSLMARVAVASSGKQSFRESGINCFGVYLRLTRGSFATRPPAMVESLGEGLATRAFMNELTLQVLQALVQELSACVAESMLTISSQQERELAHAISREVRPDGPGTSPPLDLAELQRFLAQEAYTVREYVERRGIYGEHPAYTGCSINYDTVGNAWKSVRATIPDLADASAYLCLDEYENLLPFQKIVVNTFVKFCAPQSFVKLAAKRTAFSDAQTLEGQELQEGHDYSTVVLDYNLSDNGEFRHYQELLRGICWNILQREHFSTDDIAGLLAKASGHDGIDEEGIQNELMEMLTQQGVDVARLPEDRLKEYHHRLGHAALYRVLSARGNRKKAFVGFDDLTYLSSGIIRYFLELCGMAYYLAVQAGVNVKGGQPMSPDHQTSAAHIISSYYLCTIRRNIEEIRPTIQQLVIDLGDLFRAKLLRHLSEPEATRLAIADPQFLIQEPEGFAQRILDTAEKESVFQVEGARGGFRPKHISDVQPREYVLNRIYAPVLEISVRPRWRTRISFADLSGLLSPQTRGQIKSRLMRKLVGLPSKNKQASMFTGAEHEVRDDGERS